jgi:dolichol-phosphate mannosyltransferase
VATEAQPRETVCIVIPLCNEEPSLPQLRTRLENLQSKLGERFDVSFVLVDDGSTDKTRELLPSAVPAGTHYTVVVHEANRGVGAAFRSGFVHAWNADFVCTIDADCSYGPEHLLRMVGQVEDGEADVIVASPYHPAGAVEGVQPWRLTLSKQCSRLYRMASPLKLHTYTSIFRVYRGAVVRDVRFQSDHFISAVEILLSAAASGYRISETPLTLHRRLAGASKMRVLRTICGHVKLLSECVLAGHRAPRRLCAFEKSELIYAR